MTTQILLSDEELERELEDRELARQSLYEFFKRCWHVIEPGYSYAEGFHIQAVAEHLQAALAGDIRRLVINIPPRMGKTSLASIALMPWEWITNPGRKYFYGSYSFDLALDASRDCRQLIKSDWYQRRWGKKFSLLPDLDTQAHFGNDKGGERMITSPDSTGPGRGSTRLCIDDPNSPRDVSDTMLESALHWWTQVLPSRLDRPKESVIIVIQQRVHERDITGFILANDKKNWTHLRLPNEFEAANRCVTVVLPTTKPLKWQDPRTAEGQLLFPSHIDSEHTESLRNTLLSYGYNGQYQQRPAPAEGGIIKKAWFQRWPHAEPPPIKYCIQSWDTALSERDKNAYSAATTWGVFDDEHHIPNLILLSIWRDRLEYPDLRRMAGRLIRDYRDTNFKQPLEKTNPKCRPDVILVESKVSGISLIQDLSRLGSVITPFDPTKFGDKIERVRKVTHIIEAGRLWLAAVPGTDGKVLRPSHDLFLHQASVFPNAESRDLVDTMTQALIRLTISGWVWHPDDEPAKPEYDSGASERGAMYA